MRRLVSLVATLLCCGFDASVAADPPRVVRTEARACYLLKQAAVSNYLSRRNLTGRYYCESLGDNADYFLLGLRYRTTADELVGSNLLGWFAVRRSDGALFDWDINEDRAEPLRPRLPFETESPQPSLIPWS